MFHLLRYQSCQLKYTYQMCLIDSTFRSRHHQICFHKRNSLTILAHVSKTNEYYFPHHNFSDMCLSKKQGQLDKRNAALIRNLGPRNKRLKRSGFMELAERQRECVGSLIIHHDSDNGVLLDDYSILWLSEKKYPMLKILRTRQIFMIDLDGNCAWKLYSQPGFRGKSRTISSSTYYLSFHPMSARKMN